MLYRLFDLAYACRVAAMLPASDITITNSVSLPLVLPRNRAGKIYVSVARFPKGQMALYRRADRLQAVSQAVANAIRQQSPAIADRVRVVPNALSATFSAAEADAGATRRKEILYVGRIAREKGLDLLIRAFLLMPANTEWTLTLLGPADAAGGGDGGGFLEELRCAASALGDRIRFEAPIYDERALAARMQAAAIFVYPSVAEEGESFGMAPLEAMACGCAVVVSALDCFRDFVVDGGNAVVFDHRDRTGNCLARSLQNLAERPEVRIQLGREARQTARDFSPEKVADLFDRDFIELVGA